MTISPCRLVLALTLAFMLVPVMGCASTTPDVEEPDEAVEQVDDETVEEDADESADESLDDDDTEAEPAEATKRVGADEVGYVTIPDNWVEFQDVDGNTSYQWCDGTPYTIISLNVFDIETVPEELRADFDAEAAASAVWMNMLNDGAKEEDVQGARVTLAGRDAVQVYGQYPNGSFLVCWLLTDDNGVIRYVSAEGPENTISDTVEIIQDTYEL